MKKLLRTQTLLAIAALFAFSVGCVEHRETALTCNTANDCLTGQFCGINGFCYEDAPYYDECVDYVTAFCDNLVGCDDYYLGTVSECVNDNLYDGFCEYGFADFDYIQWDYCADDLANTCEYDVYGDVVLPLECDGVFW
jgi:hypothetical protein